jgi:hypothetical protein
LKTGTIRNLLIHLPTKFEVELFRLGTDPTDQQRFASRRRLYPAELQAEVVIPTAEDFAFAALPFGCTDLQFIGRQGDVCMIAASNFECQTYNGHWMACFLPLKLKHGMATLILHVTC